MTTLGKFRPFPQCFSLKDAAVGDIIGTLDNRAFKIERIDDEDDTFCAIPEDGGNPLWFYQDGQCIGYPETNAVSLAKAPKVSIEGAREGDTFVLRNEKEYVHNGETTHSFHRGRCAGGHVLWFNFDGSCPATDDSYDVVRLISASKPSLVEQISRQLNESSGVISRVVVSREAWPEFVFRNGHCINNVPVVWDSYVREDEYSIVFKCN